MENYKKSLEYLLNYTKRVLYYVEALENGVVTIEQSKEMARIDGTSSAKVAYQRLIGDLEKEFDIKIEE